MQGKPPRDTDITNTSPGQLIPIADTSLPAYQDRGIPYSDDQLRSDRNEPDLGQSLRHHLTLLRKYKWLHLGICLLSVCAAGIYTLMHTPLYSATARIQINRASQEFLRPDTAAALKTSASDYLRTEYALLRSRSLAERVIAKLPLAGNPDFFTPRRTTLAGLARALTSRHQNSDDRNSEQLQDAAVKIINSNVTIHPLPGSRLLDIRYKDPDPARAARIANAYAAAYIASNIDGHIKANNYARSFLTKQIQQFRDRLETSEKVMLQFAKQEQVIATSEQASTIETSLSAANAALNRLIAKRIKDQELWLQVKNTTTIQMPQFLSNTAIDQLRNQRKALLHEYQEKLQTYKPGYPAMHQIKRKINEIDRQLKAEANTIRASYKAAYRNSKSQEEEMRGQIEALRADVLLLKNKQIRYNILKREADTNRSLYNDLLRRYKEVDVAGSARTTNVIIVDRARTPGTPSEPRLNQTLLLALLLSFGASTFIAYTIEVLDDRIHTPIEAEQLTGLMTISVIPSMRSKSRSRIRANQLSQEAAAQAYRTLATALQFTTHSGLPRSIAVTSAGSGEGKTATSLALTNHFTKLGLKVLLIDGNLNKPALHVHLRAKNSAGLSCYLTGALKPADIIQRTDTSSLSFIAAGPPNPDAANQLAGPQLKALVTAGLEVFDLIIIDGPHVGDTTDAILLSNAVSATLFAISANDQKKNVIRSAIRQLYIARAPLAGTVLTNFNG